MSKGAKLQQFLDSLSTSYTWLVVLPPSTSNIRRRLTLNCPTISPKRGIFQCSI